MLLLLFFTLAFANFLLKPVLTADSPCPDGRSCPETWSCCEYGCCAPAPASTSPESEEPEHMWPFYGIWLYLYYVISFTIVLSPIVWHLREALARQCRRMVGRCQRSRLARCIRGRTSTPDSAGSCYSPPEYSRCSSFHHPPPYSEVTSKPELYPLVITCGEGENKGGNYLMVHYFRNYVIREPGSLSATSTTESLNSSFVCNATNEANTIVPPPYSSAGQYEECPGGGPGTILRSMSSLSGTRAPTSPLALPLRPQDISPDEGDNITTSPIQPRVSYSFSKNSAFDLELELIDYDICCDTGCRPKLGTSPPVQGSPSQVDATVYEHDFERLQNLYSGTNEIACESPPQPTSPTQTSRESTLRRTSDERRYKRLDTLKKAMIIRKSSMYMPLSASFTRPSRLSPGFRTSSRSAPVTPSGFVPSLLAFSQRVTDSRQSSRTQLEDSNPLLNDAETKP